MFERRPFLGQVPLLGQPGGTGSPGGAFAGGGPSSGFGGGPSGPGVIGGGPMGPGVVPGGPSVSVPNQGFSTFPMSFDNFNFGWNDWWGYPRYNYPIYQQPRAQRMICRKLDKESEAAGSDVFDCVAAPPQYAAPVVGYPMNGPWLTGW